MRFVRFDGDRLGLLTDGRDAIRDLTDRLGLSTRDPLLEYLRSGADASDHAGGDADYDVSEVRLESPIRRPGKIIAAPLNYEAHIAEAVDDEAIDLDEWFSIEDFGYFLKAPSSVVGPDDQVVLPFTDRRVDHEIELAFVIGEETRDVAASEAWDRIAGYTILLDISLRGEQDRSNRKSYDSFTVIGPAMTTPDEVADPQNLDLRLSVDDAVRQDANTDDMVYTCADVVQYASMGTTLEPGDVVTTGTPAGVGPIADGDRIAAEIESVGSMSIDVTARDVVFAEQDVTKGGQE